MSTPSQDIHTIGLDMLSVALEAQSEEAAKEAVRALASDLPAEELRRVVTWLALQVTWHMRPRNSRRKVREWIERARFIVQTHDWESDRA